MPIVPYNSSDWGATLPLFIVAATALAVLVFDLLVPRVLRRRVEIAVAFVGLVATLPLLAAQWGRPVSAFGGAFITGGFTLVFEAGTSRSEPGSFVHTVRLYHTKGK